jgi:hypothetical protein
MKKFLSLVLVGLFSFSISFAGEQVKLQEKSEAEKLIESSGKRSVEKQREKEAEKVIKEAIDAYIAGQNILFMLQHNQLDKAKAELSKLEKKMEVLQKEYKGKLDKLPIATVIYEIDGVSDIKTAKKLAEQAKKAIQENDFVKARALLEALRNEIVIETQYLPIDIYKKAVELSLQFLNKGNKEKAIESLNLAINSIEVETTIIPRPIAEASILVDDASKIYKKDMDTALKLLEQAKEDIKLAKVLGYIKSENDVKPLVAQIDTLETAIKAKKVETKGLFKELKKSIKQTQEKTTQKR